MNKKTSGIVIVIMTVVFLSMLIKISDINHTDIRQDKVIKGKTTIESIDHNYSISLDGEWEFYWGQLLEPGEIRDKREDLDYFNVPNLWEGTTYRNINLDSTGAATYRMVFYMHLEENQRQVALRIPYVYSAYKLWLNGDTISSNGKVALSQKDEKVIRKPQVIVISPRQGENEIVLQISNHHFYRGGITKSIELGCAEKLFSSREKQLVMDMFMAGGFFITGLFFCLLYLIRRKELAILYFSIFCLIFFMRTMISNEVYIAHVINHFSWEIGNRLEASISYIGIPLVILLLGELYKNHLNLKFLYQWRLLAFIGVLVVTLLPHKIYDGLLIYLYLVLFAYAIYVFVAFIRCFDKSMPDFYVLLMGKCILFYFTFHDVIVTYTSIDANHKVQIGMYVFIFSLGYALVLYLYREFGKVENLMIQNENMVAEISKMNQDLERVVEKRTEELENTNRKLYELSMVDGLTKIPNRLQFDEKLNDLLIKAASNKAPLSILFLDIDFFKHYNDNYGHIQGDEALKKISWALYQKVKCDKDAFIARYGGEEFVVVYLNKDAEETYKLAEDLRLMVAGMTIPHEFSAISNHITVSIGGISLMPNKDVKATDLLDRADKALYRAKNEGRNRTFMDIDNE